MLTIQYVNDAISHYRHNKGFLRKLTGTDHPAISATVEYLSTLQYNNNLSNQDLININRFFLYHPHPVKPGHASYKAWFAINYKNFSYDLNYSQITELAKNNAETMLEFFHVMGQSYREDSLTEDYFLALGKLWMEGMLNQTYVSVIKQSQQANFLAKCLIKMKHTNTLTKENLNFIISYSGSLIIPVTHSLVSLHKAGLNTCTNREMLANFSSPVLLSRTIKWLEKVELLTQENFDLISAEHNFSWLLALEEMPERLITPEIWQGLVNLSKNSNEKDFRKDIKDCADMLKKKLNMDPTEKDSLGEEQVEQLETTQAARARFFSVTPEDPMLSVEDKVSKLSIVS